MASQRGVLIIFEGLDRSGKSTQCSMLVDKLQQIGRRVEHLRFPNRSTPIGQMINNYLAGQSQTEDHVIHLLFSANRWESAAEIESLIASGKDVVIDRYYYSGCVYTASKQITGLELAWCRQPEVGLPRPDLCLFLDVSAEVAESRGGFGTERYEKREIQERVRALFGELMQHPDEGADIVVVDADQAMSDVHRHVWDLTSRALEAAKGGLPLRKVQPW